MKYYNWPPLKDTWSSSPCHTPHAGCFPVQATPLVLWAGKGRKGDPSRHSSSLISSYNCTFLQLAPAFSRLNPAVLMQGKLFGSQNRTTTLKSMRSDFFSLSAGAGYSRFLTFLHYTSFVCTDEWSSSPVTDLKRLITTNSCRNSHFAQEIKMCVLEPKNQTVRVKHTEVNEKTPTNFSRMRNSSFSWWLMGTSSRAAWLLWLLHSSHLECLFRSPAAHTDSSVRCKIRAQITKWSCIYINPNCFSVQKYMLAMNEENIWSHNCFYEIYWAGLRGLFRAKCTQTIFLLGLLIEFPIGIPKCVKTKTVQVFTLLYWLFRSGVHQCLHNYLSEIIQQIPFKPQDCISGWSVHITCAMKNTVTVSEAFSKLSFKSLGFSCRSYESIIHENKRKNVL